MEQVAQHSGAPASPAPMLKRVLIGSFVGTSIEWYDFFVYGTAAALVFGELFFPSFAPGVGTLAAFATFGVGFVARPIGGVVFSHFGDRTGRKAMLVASLLMMGIATTVVGFLPTYDSVGIAAPIALVVLRFCQGFAVGGEWGGAVLMAVEHSDEKRRGFSGSFAQAGVHVGLILASVAFIALSPLSRDQFETWGWRIPFLASALLVVFGLVIRLGLSESPVFEEVKRTGAEVKRPVLEAVRQHGKNIFLVAAMRQETTLFYLITVFVVSYAVDHAGVSRNTVLTGVLIAAGLQLLLIPGFALLSDRVGRRPVFMFGAILGIVCTGPLFWLLDSGMAVLITIAICLGAIAHAAMYAPEPAFFAELFGANVRYSGTSLGYQLGSIIGGASPIVASALVLAADGSPVLVAIYVSALCAVALTGAYLAPETAPACQPPTNTAVEPVAATGPLDTPPAK